MNLSNKQVNDKQGGFDMRKIFTIFLLTGFTFNSLGVVSGSNNIEFLNGGYYTEQTLNNTGHLVLVAFDYMVSVEGIKYLK